ncbi:MAG: hypothetical protein E7177_01190 [Erysipelotrichaceae bacterium]|nr:hypothetical protein [Erysipelotrichaceae bacterium]
MKKKYSKLLILLLSSLVVGCGNATSQSSDVGSSEPASSVQSSQSKREIVGVKMNEESEFTIEYNDGKNLELGVLQTTDTELKVEEGYWVVGGKKTSLKLKEGERFSETYQDTLENAQIVENNSNGRYVISNNTASFEENGNYHSKKIAVRPGERYVTSFAIQSDTIMGVIFVNMEGKCISSNFHRKNKLAYFDNVELTVPEGATHLIINSHNDYPSSVKRVERKNIYRLGSETTLKVACLNCGQFDYADSSNPLTSEQYASNWKDMIKHYDADLFAFEDVINTSGAHTSITDSNGFASGIKPNDVLGVIEGTTMQNLSGIASCIRVNSKLQPVSKNIIPCEYKIEGSSAETARFYAVRYTFYMGDKLVAVYALHLVAEGHISGEPAGNSLSQQLRQKQFKTIIDDTKHFDEAIILGDFNSQVGKEYDIFRTNGFSMVNDGSIGTLRETLCADNIIVSEGIKIDNYEVIKDYKLNTDHLGLFANLTI